MGVVPKNILSEWLYYWLLTIDLKSLSHVQALPSIKQSVVADLQIPLPPADEQRRIASRLNEQLAAVESARKAAEEQLHAARQLLSSYLRVVFESQEAKKWKVLRLGDVGEIVGGVQRTPDRAPTKFHKPYLTVRNVQQGYLDLSQIERFEITPNEFERCRLHIGDILIVEGNGSIDQIGRNALFELDGDDWIHQNHIIRVRLSQEKFSPKFVSLFLNSHLGRLQMVEKAMTTSGLYTLSSGKVASLEVPSPSLDKQQEVVHDLENKLENINKIEASLESQLAEIAGLPASLLREAFAGGL
jgi:type I restriction enzyme S subunit